MSDSTPDDDTFSDAEIAAFLAHGEERLVWRCKDGKPTWIPLTYRFTRQSRPGEIRDAFRDRMKAMIPKLIRTGLVPAPEDGDRDALTISQYGGDIITGKFEVVRKKAFDLPRPDSDGNCPDC